MEMENQKKNTGLYIIIAILCVLVIVLGGYIVSSKLLDKKQDNQTNQNKTNDNTATNNDKYFSDLEKTLDIKYPYSVSNTIKKSDGTVMGYVICKVSEEQYEKYHDRLCESNTSFYYSIENKNKTKNYVGINYLDDNYIVAYYDNFNNNNDLIGCDILNIKTGSLIKNLKYSFLYSKKINNTTYYFATDADWDDAYDILDTGFNRIIKDFKSFALVVNEDNTITIIPNETSKTNQACGYKTPTKFYIYDFNNKKLYESKEYIHVVGLGKNDNTGFGYGDLLVVDNGYVKIIDYKENVIKTLTKGNICSVTDNQRVYSEYYFYLNDGIQYRYDRNNDKLISVE